MKELCIDTSHWDGVVDFNRWRDDRGLWGAIIKAGGNESNLGRYKDQLFETNYWGAKNVGLHVGAYYYTVTTDVQEAVTDAHHFADLLDGKGFDLPVYMDVEDPRQFNLSARALTDVIKAFCDTLIDRGYYAGLYIGGNAWLNNMYSNELDHYANWIAWWRGSWPTEAGDIGMWQQGSMRLSDGDIQYDDVNGYTDLDWCSVDYPSRINNGDKSYNGQSTPPNRVGPATDSSLSYAEAAAQVCEHVIEHDAHGYSQYERMGDGTEETFALSDGSLVTIHGGDYDCSELMRMCYAAVGVLPYDSYMWTGNEDDLLTSNGFIRIDPEDAQRGDILLRSGHTEMCLGDLQGGARIDEVGGITGPSQGDQTGWEITSSEFQPWRWEIAYRCVLERPVVIVNPQPETEPLNDNEIYYRAHVMRYGWLPPVRDGQIAGTEGMSLQLEALKITPPEGFDIEFYFHKQSTGWLWYPGVHKGESSGEGSSPNDPIIGSVGESLRGEAFMIRVNERPERFKDKKIKYQAHVQGIGWGPICSEGEICGTTGESRRLEAVKIWIE